MSDENDLIDKLAAELTRLRRLLDFRDRGSHGARVVADAHTFAAIATHAPQHRAPDRSVQALMRVGMADDAPADVDRRAWREVIGRRLCHSLRVEDDVRACGAVDYACVIAGLPGMAEARRVCLRVAAHLVVPRSPDGRRILRTAIGVALYPYDGDGVEPLMAAAARAREGAGDAPLGVAFATGPLPAGAVARTERPARRHATASDCR